MRGKESHARRKRQAHGITPACAGKRPRVSARCASRWDHPRVCGEKASEYTCPLISLGSPPRMRGKGNGLHAIQSRKGITPAYAGKRSRKETQQPTQQDHPRVCGEKSGQGFGLLVKVGSPPRMRGKDRLWQKCFHKVGITPAYAGKRQDRPRSSWSAGDHPRVCGEKFAQVVNPIRPTGSPPRMRGKER